MDATLERRYKIGMIVLSLVVNLIFLIPFIVLHIEQIPPEVFFLFQSEPVDELDDQKTVLQQDHEELIQHILSSGMVAPDPAQDIQRDQEIQASQVVSQLPGEMILDVSEVKEAGETSESAMAEEELQSYLQEEQVVDIQKQQFIKDQKKIMRRPQENSQKSISLGSIAQGFLKSMQQEEGLNNPPAMDADTLAAHQYATKVWNIIKNSFRADANMLHLSQNVDVVAYLVMTIQRNGRLIDIRLESNKPSIGLRQIEALIIEHAKKSGLFPPLPQRFAQEQKTFTYPIHIQGQEGYHSYRLSYGAAH